MCFYTGFTLLLISSLFNLCSATGHCTVSNLEVQENFDLEKFTGKWYEHKWHTTDPFPPSDVYTNYIHYYTPLDTGNLTNYISYRYPDTEKCDFKHGTLIPGDSPGRLTWLSETGKVSSYLILDTDYTQYALVYGCYNVSETGRCVDALAVVWGRSPQPLPDSLNPRLETFYHNICVNESDFITITQDNECDVPKVYKMNPDQNCSIDSFSVQDLDKEKFAGLWYEMHWLTQDPVQASSILTNFMNEFIKVDDSKFDIYTRGRGDVCLYYKLKFEETSTPDQYKYEGMIHGNAFKYDSWIIETDYTNYAVQFSCGEMTEGVCTKNVVNVWSRRQTLSPQYMHRVNTVLQSLCLNPTSAFSFTQDNVCPPWKEVVCETSNGMPTSPCVTMTLTLGCLVFMVLPYMI